MYDHNPERDPGIFWEEPENSDQAFQYAESRQKDLKGHERFQGGVKKACNKLFGG